MSKTTKSKMAASVLKKIHFTNNFTTIYDRDTHDMSILMFSGMRNPIRHLFLEKRHRRSTFLQIQAQIAEYHC